MVARVNRRMSGELTTPRTIDEGVSIEAYALGLGIGIYWVGYRARLERVCHASRRDTGQAMVHRAVYGAPALNPMLLPHSDAHPRGCCAYVRNPSD